MERETVGSIQIHSDDFYVYVTLDGYDLWQRRRQTVRDRYLGLDRPETASEMHRSAKEIVIPALVGMFKAAIDAEVARQESERVGQ